MCGIVGYTGKQEVQPILLQGLKRLEYRGYDSAGIAVVNKGSIRTVKRIGKVSELEQALSQKPLQGTTGIAHTRWATHGKPSKNNAHPHTSCSGNIAIVHNGIIENFTEIREDLVARGHTLASDTDSEVIAHLIEETLADLKATTDSAEKNSAQTKRNTADHNTANHNTNAMGSTHSQASLYTEAVARATQQLIGSYALAVLFEDVPDTIIATKRDSPLILGIADDEAHVASDIIALLDYTRDVIIMQERTIAELTPTGITIFDAHDPEQLSAAQLDATHIDWDADLTEKGGYPDFMLKEIHEQPRVIRDTLAGRLVGNRLTIDELSLSPEELNLIDRVYIIACGTSYHAGLIAKNLIEDWAQIPTEVEVASEFRYRNPIIKPTTLVVAVSQSGETADTIAAIRDARSKGARVFGITNVVGSTVARDSDGVIYTKANKEIAVASTKSFLGQVVSLTLLALLLSQTRGKLSSQQIQLLFSELADTAEQVDLILQDTSRIDAAAKACKDSASALFVGRGMGATIANEGALKLKEISYLHAEAYPAGEMKHGPIALVDTGFPIIAIATDSPTYEKVISNLEECKARGALVIAIATEGNKAIQKHADYVIYVPRVRDAFSAITASVPLQLFARSIALLRGCDVDQPRNLAKSVTVE